MVDRRDQDPMSCLVTWPDWSRISGRERWQPRGQEQNDPSSRFASLVHRALVGIRLRCIVSPGYWRPPGSPSGLCPCCEGWWDDIEVTKRRAVRCCAVLRCAGVGLALALVAPDGDVIGTSEFQLSRPLSTNAMLLQVCRCSVVRLLHRCCCIDTWQMSVFA